MSKVSKRGTKWERQRQRVIARMGPWCAYCQKGPLEGQDLTVDHLDPVAMDPDAEHSDDRCVVACRTCNGRRQDQPLVRMDYYSPAWFAGAE